MASTKEMHRGAGNWNKLSHIGLKFPKNTPSLFEVDFHGNKISVESYIEPVLDILLNSMEMFESDNIELIKASRRVPNSMHIDYLRFTNAMIEVKYQEYKNRASDSILNTLVFDYTSLFRWLPGSYDDLAQLSSYNTASDVIMVVMTLTTQYKKSLEDILVNIYDSLDPMAGLKYRTDLSLGIITWLVLNWSVGVLNNMVRSSRVPLELQRDVAKIQPLSEDVLNKFAKGKNSKFIQYLEGKITSEKLIADRNKKYKTRITDYQLDQIVTARKVSGKKLNKYLDTLTEDDLDWYSETFTYNWTRYLYHVDKVYRYTMDKDTPAFKLFSLVEEYKEKLEAANKEIDNKSTEIEQLRFQDDKKKRKVEQLKSEISILKKNNTELSRNKKINESVVDLKDKLNSKDEEIKQLQSELIALNRELKETKKKYSDTKKEARLLEVYRDYFGDLYTEDEDTEVLLEETKDTSFEEILSTLKDYKFVICSYDLNHRIEQDLAKLGLNALVFNSENNPAINSQFDIAIIHATFCSHSMMYMIKNKAEQLNAVSLYFSGANVEKMLRAVYNELQK